MAGKFRNEVAGEFECPFCGAGDVVCGDPFNGPDFLLFFTRCTACGRAWTDTYENPDARKLWDCPACGCGECYGDGQPYRDGGKAYMDYSCDECMAVWDIEYEYAGSEEIKPW